MTAAKTIRGRFACQLDPMCVKDGWSNRFASLAALEANLETNGTDFCITHNRHWDVDSLKRSFELEVHRVDSGCKVIWFE